ncbi:hypothetical protein L1887_51348 [Cichorium endivia]|nr:hypothetical protein L1887_51348 [Cichorium endivia]
MGEGGLYDEAAARLEVLLDLLVGLLDVDALVVGHLGGVAAGAVDGVGGDSSRLMTPWAMATRRDRLEVGERGGAGGGVGHDADALVDEALGVERLEDPPYGLHEVDVHGLVAVSQPKRRVDIVAGGVGVSGDNVLDGAGEEMAVVGQTGGEGRAVVEAEGFPALGLLERGLEGVDGTPVSDDLFLLGGEAEGGGGVVLAERGCRIAWILGAMMVGEKQREALTPRQHLLSKSNTQQGEPHRSSAAAASAALCCAAAAAALEECEECRKKASERIPPRLVRSRGNSSQKWRLPCESKSDRKMLGRNSRRTNEFVRPTRRAEFSFLVGRCCQKATHAGPLASRLSPLASARATPTHSHSCCNKSDSGSGSIDGTLPTLAKLPPPTLVHRATELASPPPHVRSTPTQLSQAGDALEAAILQGVDANPASTYREDRRAASSHSAPNTDDELGSDLSHHDDDRHLYSATTRTICPPPHLPSRRRCGQGRAELAHANRGAEGATNTGPKGVLRDQQLRAAQESAARSAAVHATNRRMESLALSSETYTQQVERERREAALRLHHELDDDQHTVSREAIADLQAKERRREARIAELKAFHASRSAADPTASAGVGSNERWFGHLREVDERGYVAAIDNEVHDVPIVIHIYSKAVEQCKRAHRRPRRPRTRLPAHQVPPGPRPPPLASDTVPRISDEEFDELNPKTLEVLPDAARVSCGQARGQPGACGSRPPLESRFGTGSSHSATAPRCHPTSSQPAPLATDPFSAHVDSDDD